MSGLVLTLRTPLAADADLSGLTAEGWEQADAAAMAARLILLDRAPLRVGDLCEVSGTAGSTLALHGDFTRAHRIGAGLASGTVVVHSSVGDGAGLAMRGGRLQIHGHAGHQLGAAPAGAKRGMTGGEILVHGSAGDESGSGVRRGLIAIGGDAGARTARGGIAGTIYVVGTCGADTGLFLKRASVIVGGSMAVPAGFREACTYDPAVVRLLQRHLRMLGFPLPSVQLGGSWRRFSGDAGEGSRGELLLWTT